MSDAEQQTPQQKQGAKSIAKPPRPRINSWMVFTCIMGAFSILNIINEFNIVKLEGTIAKWIGGYHEVVTGIVKFMTGWLEWKWMKVDSLESHVTTLSVLITGSCLRSVSNQSHMGVTSPGRYHLVAIAVTALTGAAVLALMWIMPSPIGIIVGLLVLLSHTLMMFSPGTDKYVVNNKLYHASLKRTWIGIAVMVAILVCANELI